MELKCDTTRRKYDLEERARAFAVNIRQLVWKLPKRMDIKDDLYQLIRSSGSVGANYIEANEGLGPKDFLLHLKIARKEAKESHHWLLLIQSSMETSVSMNDLEILIRESKELVLILSSIIKKLS